ncbi:MAG: cytochrome c family protein [Alphaproteobacteria bacterium HGW-Alphaproteobacteria-14]|nr:MAG: cytochrome c family protein [Alphaproteobacteria bacterium HGW-Alphaproteobacteria-14]
MKRRFIPFAALTFALTFALAACGKSADDTPDTSSTAQVDPVAAAPAQALKPAAVAATDPVAHGKTLFARCASCHSIAPGKNGIGPSLHAITGKASASLAEFTYSPAMQSANLTWDDATLSAYLENPQGLVKGNRMAFAGLKNPQDRADLIAYLHTLK